MSDVPTAMTRKTLRLVTVHGTGDTAVSPDGDKWFQRGAAFTRRLVDRLSSEGYDAEVVPLLWSGANSAMARSSGANKLKHAVRRLARGGQGVHVIGHSHGGNVANDAACRLNWRRAEPPGKIASLTTVGTPFLRERVGFVEATLTWLFAVVLALGMSFALYLSAESGVASGYWVVFVLDLLAIPFAAAAFVRLRRATRKKRERPTILALRHPSDEAIAFLEHVERLDLEPFPPGSLTRGAGPGAAFIATVATVVAPLVFAPILSSYVADLVRQSGTATTPAEAIASHLLSQIAMTTVLAGMVFPIVYILTRGAALIVMEGLLRGTMNRRLGDVLKGLALGRDGGLDVGDVSAQSHQYGTRDVVLDGALAERMNAASTEATRRLFEKYRSSLFSLGADASNALIELTRDSMTWDSLIHTTYFDQPEVADIIADHILAAERQRG